MPHGIQALRVAGTRPELCDNGKKKNKAHLLVAEPRLAFDGGSLADHEEVLLALLLQVSQPAGVCVALELLSAPNDAFQPIHDFVFGATIVVAHKQPGSMKREPKE